MTLGAVARVASVYIAWAPIRPTRSAGAAQAREPDAIRLPKRPSRRPERQDDVDRQARRGPPARPLLQRPGRAGPRGLLRGEGEAAGVWIGTGAASLGLTGEEGLARPDRESRPARRKARNPAAIEHCARWRDPDSNRGHHDFQSWPRRPPTASESL